MRLRDSVLLLLGAVFASAASVALADTPAPAVSTGGDVTMTVIPSGQDVVKTVVQTIVVPANANKLAKGKSAEPQKAKPATGQDSEAAAQTAQQLAEAAAEHQAGQTQQQVQQQALQAQQAAQVAAAKARNPSPPPPPPPPPPRG
ncbi:MAG: hypothetical protein ACM3ZT_07810 [Bacillota bacterium]